MFEAEYIESGEIRKVYAVSSNLFLICEEGRFVWKSMRLFREPIKPSRSKKVVEK